LSCAPPHPSQQTGTVTPDGGRSPEIENTEKYTSNDRNERPCLTLLLWKLDAFYGIRGLPLKLLASYFQGRQQYTVVAGYKSSMLEITQGVPQVSSLGPLLFALYVNDLPKHLHSTPFLLVDDTVLSISNGNCIELQKLVLSYRK